MRLSKHFINLFLISFLLFMIGCSRKIPQVSGEIITEDNYKGIVLEKEKLDYLPVEVDSLETWIPKENDIRLAEQILSEFIQKDSVLSFPLNEYTRQYFGIIENSDKVIYINSFCMEEDDSFMEGWKTDFIEVEDGGDCFFQIKVNLEKEDCYEFYINGEA